MALLAPVDPSSPLDLTDGLPFFALAALAWLFTYALHSTLMLGSAWLATRRMSDARAGLRERVWKFAILAAFVTASVQVGMGFEPLGGRLALRRAAFVAERSTPLPRSPASEMTSDQAGTARDLAMGPANPVLWSALLARQAIGKLDSSAGAALTMLLRDASHPAAQSPDVSAPDFGASNDTAVLAPIAPELTGAPQTSGAASIANAGPWFARLGEWTQWAFATCALGALAGLCLFALLWLRLNGCLRDRVELEHGALADKLRELCQRAGIRRRVRLSVAPSLGAPISMGMFRPEICVPPRVLLELSDEEQEALLAHELAHVVRRDPLWLAVCRLFEGVFFFQPLNRVARHEIEDCAEFLSDAWAVRHTGLRFSLASCLTRIAEWIVGERRMLPAPAMAHGRSRLRHRVELLLDESAAESVDRHPRWLPVACTGFCATLVLVVPCVSASEDALHRGDRGELPFLPDRDAPLESAFTEKNGESEQDAECKSSCEKESCESDAAENAQGPSDEFDEMASELDALDDEISKLRLELSAIDVSALDRKPMLARDLREVSLKLAQAEMNIARVRELRTRIEILRASASSASTAPGARIERSNMPAFEPPMNHATSTSSVNREEISK
ncbi:MAG: M56 family metallopeptidase [Planctomycetota bacterium]